MSKRIETILSKRLKIEEEPTVIDNLFVTRGLVFIYDNEIHVWDGTIGTQIKDHIQFHRIEDGGYFKRSFSRPTTIKKITASNGAICIREEGTFPVGYPTRIPYDVFNLCTTAFMLMRDLEHGLWKILTEEDSDFAMGLQIKVKKEEEAKEEEKKEEKDE